MSDLAPVEIGSTTAKILHRVWSGHRYIQVDPGSDDPTAMVVAVVAHLHTRRDHLSTQVVGHSAAKRRTCHRALRDLLGEEEVVLHRRSAIVTDPARDGVAVAGVIVRPPMRVTATSMWSDLLVVVDPPKFSTAIFGSSVLSGRQVVMIARSWPTLRTDMAPIPCIDMPLDIAIAGEEP